MFIKSVTFENHQILGNASFDFCDACGKPYNTIILAGENGAGKSSLLNEIFGIAMVQYPQRNSLQKSRYVFELSDFELPVFRTQEFLIHVISVQPAFIDVSQIGNELKLEIDHSLAGWAGVKASISTLSGNTLEFSSHLLNNESYGALFRAIYSDVEVSYSTDRIQHTTALNVDTKFKIEKSTAQSAREIQQLLVDIDELDNADLRKWMDSKRTSDPNTSVSEWPEEETRIKRFTKAFDMMFPNKKFVGVTNVDGAKEVQFKEFDKVMSISNLSSGEKQIVFRGSYLLRNKLSAIGAFVFVDEPEISLHPAWQQKILDFYKNLFRDEHGEQTSQLFIATHSPFIIHNDNRVDDIVLVLKKDANGNVFAPDDGKFVNWTSEEIVKEAFDVSLARERVAEAMHSPKHLVITEGKTDWKHLKRALNKMGGEIRHDDFVFLEYENEYEMGSSHLFKLCDYLRRVERQHKVIAVFDRDEKSIVKQVTMNDGELPKHWGNQVYSFAIPKAPHRTVEEICIEHYYTDDEIKTADQDGKRLYLGNEFTDLSIHTDLTKICKEQNKCGLNSIQIIDNKVYSLDRQNVNIALPKSHFAQNILEERGPFQHINSTRFKPIFEIIRGIIDSDGEQDANK